jgi:CheY-like chemotaxis protein/tetratricopeptide (TPR) repeat protein
MSHEILIVEDDHAQARLFARIVERAGYRSRSVHNGGEALDAVRCAPPAAIVLDLLLPGRSGEAVLAELMRDPPSRHVPVIAVSAFFRGRETATRLIEAGAAAFLHKPFTADALLQALRVVLGETDAESDTPVRVDLASVPVPEFVWGAVEREFTGALHFARDRRRKTLLLERGRPVAIRSNLAEETLGRRLRRQGRIDPETERSTTERARQAGELLGEILVEMGLLTSEEIDREIRLQAAHKIMDLFAWTEGQGWEEPGVRGLAMSTSLEGWTAEQLMTRGAALIPRERLLQLMEPYSEFLVSLGEAETLTGIEDPLRARLAQGVRLADIEGTQVPAVYAAWRVGKLRMDAPDGESSGHAQSAALARKLAALSELQKEQDLFSVLELDVDATPEQVEAAYARLAPRYAPERFTAHPQRVQSLAETLRARVDLARTILSDPLTADGYAARVRSWQVGEADRACMTQHVCADAELQRGEALLGQRSFAEARRAFDKALELNPDDPDAIALHAWAELLCAENREAAASLALERLTKARRLDPRAVRPLYYLGLLCKQVGRLDQAVKAMKQVLTLRPDDRNAQRELRLLQSRSSG